MRRRRSAPALAARRRRRSGAGRRFPVAAEGRRAPAGQQPVALAPRATREAAGPFPEAAGQPHAQPLPALPAAAALPRRPPLPPARPAAGAALPAARQRAGPAGAGHAGSPQHQPVPDAGEVPADAPALGLSGHRERRVGLRDGPAGHGLLPGGAGERPRGADGVRRGRRPRRPLAPGRPGPPAGGEPAVLPLRGRCDRERTLHGEGLRRVLQQDGLSRPPPAFPWPVWRGGGGRLAAKPFRLGRCGRGVFLSHSFAFFVGVGWLIL